MTLQSLFWRKKHKSQLEFINNRAPIRAIPQALENRVTLKTINNHAFIEIGEGKPIIFSHGIFGGLFNISKLAIYFSGNYKIVMPFLPMYDTPLHKCTISELGSYLASFVNDLKFENYVVLASSMGGGATIEALSHCHQKPKGIILCGSSGLSAIPLSKGFVKRKNFEFVFDMSRDIFYNRNIPEKEMAVDIFNCLQNIEVLMRAIKFTKSTTNTNQRQLISAIEIPSLLIWGKQDPITPLPFAFEFNKLIKGSELVLINECGHVPTQEAPELVYMHIKSFFGKINF